MISIEANMECSRVWGHKMADGYRFPSAERVAYLGGNTWRVQWWDRGSSELGEEERAKERGSKRREGNLRPGLDDGSADGLMPARSRERSERERSRERKRETAARSGTAPKRHVTAARINV